MRPNRPPPGAWGAVGAAYPALRSIEAAIGGHPLAAFLWGYAALAALITISWFVAGLLNKPR